MDVHRRAVLMYEMGVMMFNATEDRGLCKIEGDYDLLGNLKALLDAVGDFEYDDMKEGFLAEARNYGIRKEDAESMFENAKVVLEEY